MQSYKIISYYSGKQNTGKKILTVKIDNNVFYRLHFKNEQKCMHLNIESIKVYMVH